MVKKICLIRDICGCFYSEKKNFHTTRQLVTLNAASYCDSFGYSGDSFQNTRHQLIILSFPDFSLQFLVIIKLPLLTSY